MTLREPFSALEGSAAVVTGAAGGIGLEIVQALRGLDLTLVLVDRDAAELDVALAGLGGEQVAGVAADLTTEEGHQAISAALEPLVPLSIWVNDAGIVSHQLSQVVDRDSFERVIRTNTWSAIRGALRVFAPSALSVRSAPPSLALGRCSPTRGAVRDRGQCRRSGLHPDPAHRLARR